MGSNALSRTYNYEERQHFHFQECLTQKRISKAQDKEEKMTIQSKLKSIHYLTSKKLASSELTQIHLIIYSLNQS